LAKIQRIKKRYTFFSAVIIFSIVLLFNLILSTTSKTDIIHDASTKRPDIAKQIIESLIQEQSKSIKFYNNSIEPEYIIKKGSINRQPIYCELRDHGVSSLEILKLSDNFRNVFDFKRAQKGDQYTLFFSKDNELMKFIYKRDLLTQYLATKNDNGVFLVEKQEFLLTKETVVKKFILKDSLFQTILSGGEGHTLAFQFAEIFSWDIDFFLFPRTGDRVQIEFEKLSKDGKFVKYGKILAARYIAPGKTFSAFLFNNGKFENYYDENGKPMRKMFLRVPIKSGHITSSFSLRRFHPVLKKYRRHTGIDYGSRTGTPIFATANGKVRFAGWSPGYGKLVIVVHPNGYETYYGHCSKLLVKPGKFVSQGEVVAKVGSTGHATGPHVHYEVRINRKPINPNMIKSTPGKPLAEKYLAEYKTLVGKRLNSLESNIKVALSTH